MLEVSLENVSKLYGRKVAVRDISFSCKAGEFFSIIGPTGAGKTTILKMIAGIEKVSSGKVYFNERVVNELPPQERDVSMAFESYNLYPNFSVYDNIAFPLRAPKLRGSLSHEEERQKVEAIADFLGIMKLLERKPVELSGGEKQRVSLARAMVREPQIYLLDEPIAHLDARLKFSTQTLLKKLAGKLGVTIVYVTHDYREALALSDRILVLRRGGIEQIGTPEEVYYVPSSDFVGRFVGEPPINLIDGEVVSEGKKTFFRAGDDFSIQIREDLLSSMEGVASQEDGKRMVRLGIRCSNIKVAEEKIGDNSFQLPVFAVAQQAESSLVTFELKDVFLQVKLEKRVKYGLSDKVWLDFDQDRILFFKKTVELAKG
ncbi:MAG: ABC transporter ATP-binding protein [Dehalococcoidia bacterium]|nr:ABC transporter ATP-binding protein [Dehalococcoidia bacterium]